MPGERVLCGGYTASHGAPVGCKTASWVLLASDFLVWGLLLNALVW
jgi:hypothetical protein